MRFPLNQSIERTEFRTHDWWTLKAGNASGGLYNEGPRHALVVL
jgi:hypothetical protein